MPMGMAKSINIREKCMWQGLKDSSWWHYWRNILYVAEVIKIMVFVKLNVTALGVTVTDNFCFFTVFFSIIYKFSHRGKSHAFIC